MTRNDTRIIHTDGLEEGIRCAMCTNPMANNRGCDGGCDINESMYKRVLDVIKKNILEQEPKTDTWSIKDVADTLAKHGLIAGQEPCEDCISRQALLKLMGEEPFNWTDSDKELQEVEDYRNFRNIVKQLPSVDLQKSKERQFAKWVATEIFDDMWNYNKDTFAEIACRKLAKLGIVRASGDVWELVKPHESEEEE